MFYCSLFSLVTKFEDTGSVEDDRKGKTGRPATAITPENIERVQTLFEETPTTSLRHAAQQLEMSYSSVQRILKEELHMCPYKIQLYQPLKECNVIRRFDFANTLVEKIEREDFDVNRIWFSDEAHFQLHGYVNKQNWRHWGKENPHLAVASPLHSQRVTVWCALSSKGIVGPIFIEGNVTAPKYKEILENQFIPQAKKLKMVQNCWFMQDGARPHRTADVFDCLQTSFGPRVIGLDYQEHTGRGIEWPPYSPDLNPCDFFLWGFLKDRVYREAPGTLQDLKLAIQRQVTAIQIDHCVSVIEGFRKRLYHLIVSNGRHIENILH